LRGLGRRPNVSNPHTPTQTPRKGKAHKAKTIRGGGWLIMTGGRGARPHTPLEDLPA
jgi:hypothetical protein